MVERVTAHMNDDHSADNLLIVRANGYPEATSATMTGLDEHAAFWRVTDAAGEHELRVAWPNGPISERPEIRREVVVLFEAAAEALGVKVEPREEHAHGEHGAHDGHEHGGHHRHGSHGAAAGAPADGSELAGEKPFSVVIRESSWSAHGDSEGADFMANIMRGVAPLADYEELVAQHYPLYVALEETGELLLQDERTAKFMAPGLTNRAAALEKDLEHLWGAQWRERVEPVQSTAEYVARIREIAAEGWLPGIVAQHYTRYLGDLSGGQMIARRMRKQHGFESDGVAFYEFDELGDLTEFKEQYRAWLDELGASMDEEERQRFLAEVQLAYDFNTRMFIDLAAKKAAAAE
ncbi:DUF2470 domain-containing protein [Leucobacter sp. OH2974_COT-288]|nr:DUF2470 domain-containing protein [Leucobacter sp. OH2974_COT-288]